MKEYFYKSANVTYYMENNEFFKNSEQLTLIEEDKTFDITDFKKLIQQDLKILSIIMCKHSSRVEEC